MMPIGDITGFSIFLALAVENLLWSPKFGFYDGSEVFTPGPVSFCVRGIRGHELEGQENG
ncbi:hypothetical protein [Neorhizobium alkalisoli]|uniref:hypothetical protein n=1 Tax=Neorhizobium alkalisoli TaxID=528178 RepID=UPI00119D1C68|nr:hypothetical protein [Neorhizobium alkalisoli]